LKTLLNNRIGYWLVASFTNIIAISYDHANEESPFILPQSYLRSP